jgi:hypothetical protein
MFIGRSAAFLASAVGVLVISGAGGALAVERGVGQVAGLDGGGRQSNDCSTSSVLGPVEVATPLTGVGTVSTETTCVNYAESGVSEQSNHCETSSVVGAVVVNLSLAPAESVETGTTCVNYTESSGVSKQTNDCETSSVIGPLAVSPLAPGPEIDTASRCVNVAGGR